MKKYFGLLTGLLMVFFVTGTAMAITFTDEQNLDSWMFCSGEHSWSHTTPADLAVPWDTVNSATLEVWANLVNGTNDVVSVGTITGTLTNSQTWIWTGFFSGYNEDTHFNLDVTEAFDPWSASILDVTLSWNEPWYAPFLYLDRSLLTIDYENGSAPVPEPATMLLLGAGLVGLAGFSKRKLKN